ncbi:MAG: hypothetical protein ACLUE2_01540 [Bacteroides cellulosilyticus]
MAFSQQATTVIKPDLKYGKPSKEELSLETYAPDTTAVAVYLFHKGKSGFTYNDKFEIVYGTLGTHQDIEAARCFTS